MSWRREREINGGRRQRILAIENGPRGHCRPQQAEHLSAIAFEPDGVRFARFALIPLAADDKITYQVRAAQFVTPGDSTVVKSDSSNRRVIGTPLVISGASARSNRDEQGIGMEATLKRTNAGVVCAYVILAVLSLTARLAADIVVPGADGSDGKLIVSSNLTIDLGKAVAGKWDDPGGDVDGDGVSDGVYDGQQWAVVFKYESVEIKSGATLSFKNHPWNPPVVWLVMGACNIAGTVVLDGAEGHSWSGNHVVSTPGPGGFRGGHGNDLAPGSDASSGFGPGGGTTIGNGSNGGGGGYSVPGGNGRYGNRDSGKGGNACGNARLLPLFGGSGGAGGFYGWDYSAVGGGGAGGGAILIASQTTITLDGVLSARGGDGYNDQNNYVGLGGAGSGGGIRVVCDRLIGAGKLRAQPGVPRWYDNSWYGGYASPGRIRVESNDTSGFSHLGDPPYTSGLPGDSAVLWPDQLGAPVPTVRATELGGKAVPNDPRSSLSFPLADVSLASTEKVKIKIEARDMPIDWSVNVRVVRKVGLDAVVVATFVSGDASRSQWEADLDLGDGFAAIQVRAAKK